MCLAAFRPADTEGRITASDLNHSYDNGNNDAFGVMWCQDAKLHVWKSAERSEWTKFLEFVSMLQDVNLPLAVHLRWATHGTNGIENAHPFEVIPGKLGIVHNGIISQFAHDKAKASDTALFAKHLKQLPKGWLYNSTIVALVEHYIGRSNKVIALQSDGMYGILNESAGLWERGIWWSNTSFQYDYDWYSRHCGYSESWHYRSPVAHQLGLGKVDDDGMAPNKVQNVRPTAAVYNDGSVVCCECVDDYEAIHVGTTPVTLLFDNDPGDGLLCEVCGEWLEARSYDA